jgi:NAD(P)-dependent dehydrogenase (short-subunit alcohol dehydrogenase family)
MDILVIGATGIIGKRVSAFLSKKHNLIRASKSSSDISVDISDSHSILEMYKKAGDVDAIVCIAGEAKWNDLNTLTEDDYYIGIRSKLMGQVNVVRLGRDYLRDKGSITLTTGVLADKPVVKTSSAAMVNGAIHSFVKAASLEMERGIRLNVVSPNLVEDSALKYANYFPGYNVIPMDRVVNAYIKSIEGKNNGEIIRIYL